MSTNDISIIKGDTFEADIYVKSEDGTVFPITNFTILMAVSKGAPSLDPNLIINKAGTVVDGPAGIAHIILLPAETTLLSPGSYKYDIQITSPEGNVYTVVRYATMEVGQSVSP